MLQNVSADGAHPGHERSRWRSGSCPGLSQRTPRRQVRAILRRPSWRRRPMGGFLPEVRNGGSTCRGEEVWAVRVASSAPPPNEVSQYVTVHVEDVDGYFEHARQCGARILKSPTDMPFGGAAIHRGGHLGSPLDVFLIHRRRLPPRHGVHASRAPNLQSLLQRRRNSGFRMSLLPVCAGLGLSVRPTWDHRRAPRRPKLERDPGEPGNDAALLKAPRPSSWGRLLALPGGRSRKNP